MDKKTGRDKAANGLRISHQKRINIWECLGLVILILYPLRHINWGLDLWDTGYNYANFRYFGTEHMDPMWLFSTYLANAAGSLITKLPGAGGLIGMNFYTGLAVSLLALAGYFFCTRKLKMPKALVFVGEMTAVSLCWCPTALLYNYLTYLFFLVSSILLYMGLTEGKKACLFWAGVLLGTNVLVRFSNLPEAGMILAVWAYDFILWRQERKAGGQKGQLKSQTKQENAAGSRTGQPEAQTAKRWPRPLRHTLLCFAGYLAALGVLLGFIHIRYGLGEYVNGIQRLFAMTDNATDYKPTAMIMGVVGTYVENLYWVIRIMAILLAGMALAAAADRLERLCVRRRGKTPESGRAKREKCLRLIEKSLHVGVRILLIMIGGAMLIWLYYRKFCSVQFTSYDSMLRPGILFLMLTMLIAVIRIFSVRAAAQEKLISGMLILIIVLTSLGSNNDVYPSLNNLFLAAPYTLWQSWRFLRNVGDRRLSLKLRHSGRKAAASMQMTEQQVSRQWIPGRSVSFSAENSGSVGDEGEPDSRQGLLLSGFPAKVLLTAFLAMCLFQFAGFGAGFVFAEATGVQEATAYVENNAVLKNVRMSPRKAQWMRELSAYVDANGLEGWEVILYGDIPALSYYLQMPSAFNPWSDLDSYGYEVMEKDLEELAEALRGRVEESPVVIVENRYILYEEGGTAALEAAGISEKNRKEIEEDPKWPLLGSFMEEFGYKEDFRNEKFTLYRSAY